jgi:uncharacterized protein (TIGR00255 family)
MSVVSMTGFGRGEAHGRGVKVTVEIGSVNRRQFDCHVSLPRELSALEANLHALIQTAIRRGQVKGLVQVASYGGAAEDGGLSIDIGKAAAQLAALRRAARKLKLPDDFKSSLLLQLPDVARCASQPGDPLALWPLVRQAARQALANLQAMRLREGRALARDLARRFRVLRRLWARLSRRARVTPRLYRETLARRLRRAGVAGDADPAALTRELALFADRSDVSEELTRLGSHLDQAERLMADAAPGGRPLDFLCQELLREINTVGSKSSDTPIARLVMEFKAQLEAAREQIQNVE